jgi:3-hydroxyisobutyrate dehydrogenase
MRYGFLGLGRMGGLMATRIAAAGLPLTVWARRSASTAPLADKGAKVAQTLPELVANSDVIFSIVKDDPTAIDLYERAGGLLTHGATGKLFVEMSTLKPETVHRLGGVIAMKGGRLLEMPVMGSAQWAESGQLVGLAGGAAEDIALAEPATRHMMRKIINAGALGNGALTKLAVNLVVCVYAQALSEAIALGAGGGLSTDATLEALSESAVAAPFLKFKLDVLKGNSPPPEKITAAIATVRKDLFSITSVASGLGVPVPAASAALASFSAACAAGWADREFGDLANFYRQQMGMKKT